MIAASAVLVVAALVLLIVGVFQDGLELVFGSIAASIIAAISLFLGVLRDRREPVTAPGYPAEGASVGGVPPIAEAASATSGPVTEDLEPVEAPPLLGGPETAAEDAPLILPDDDELEVPPAPAPATRSRKTGAKKPAAKKKTAKKPAAKKAAAKKPAAKKKTAKKPAAKKAAAKKPAAKKKTAKKPAAKKTAAKKTTTRRSAS